MLIFVLISGLFLLHVESFWLWGRGGWKEGVSIFVLPKCGNTFLAQWYGQLKDKPRPPHMDVENGGWGNWKYIQEFEGFDCVEYPSHLFASGIQFDSEKKNKSEKSKDLFKWKCNININHKEWVSTKSCDHALKRGPYYCSPTHTSILKFNQVKNGTRNIFEYSHNCEMKMYLLECQGICKVYTTCASWFSWKREVWKD